MNKNEIKKILASVSIVTLLVGAGFSIGGCRTTSPMPMPRYYPTPTPS